MHSPRLSSSARTAVCVRRANNKPQHNTAVKRKKRTVKFSAFNFTAMILAAFALCSVLPDGVSSHAATRRAAATITPRQFASPRALQRNSSQASTRAAYGKLPLSFEANHGQTNPEVKFLSRGQGYTLFLTPTESVLVLSKRAHAPRHEMSDVARRSVVSKQNAVPDATLRMQLVNSNVQARLTGLDHLSSTNHLTGSNPQQWHLGVPNYAQVKYEGVYPNIDLLFHGNRNELEYDFILAPGAQVADILLNFEGAEKLSIDAKGDLVLRVNGNVIRQSKPYIYQETGDGKKQIAGNFTLKGKNRVGFQVESYDLEASDH